MRIYVLVTSFDPLIIYMYQDGLCRFATEKYTTKVLKKRFIHLTNYSVNKRADNFVQNQDGDQHLSAESQSQSQPSKWSLKQLKEHIMSSG